MSINIEGKVFIKDKLLFCANFDKLKTVAEGGANLKLLYVPAVRATKKELELYKKGLDESYNTDYLVLDWNSIYIGLKEAEKDLEKARKSYEAVKAIRYTKDFYSFDEDEKYRYFEDLDDLNDSYTDLDWQVDALQYIRDVMILASEMYKDLDSYEYHDVDEVRLFLYYN